MTALNLFTALVGTLGADFNGIIECETKMLNEGDFF